MSLVRIPELEFSKFNQPRKRTAGGKNSIDRGRRTVCFIGLLALVALTACSASDDTAERGQQPLEDLISSISFLADISEADLLRKQALAEELIADCMKNQGFEYKAIAPVPQPQQISQAPTSEYVSTYGFGINTGSSPPFVYVPLTENANDVYFASLGVAEQEQYTLALHGSGVVENQISESGAVTTGPDGTQESLTEEQLGCYGVANRDAGLTTPSNMRDDPDVQDFFAKLDLLTEAIENDPRVTVLASEYTNCMFNSGFPDIEVSGGAQWAVAKRTAETYSYIFEDLGDNGYVVTSLNEGVLPPPPPRERAEEVRDFELTIAVADFQCRIDYQKMLETVRVEKENDFIEQNEELIERLRNLSLMTSVAKSGG